MLALDKVTRADFEPVLQQDFELITGTGGITLTLAEIHAGFGSHKDRAEPFTLVFRGAPPLRLPQSIYPLQNTTLGQMELFLVQVAANDEGSFFEAVFN